MIQWLEQHQFICIYKHFLGIRCPTCGFQSSLIYLLKGELHQSIVAYPPLIPSLLVLIVLVIWLVFRKPSWKFLRYLLIVDLILVFSNWLFL
jgi:hypothetical protein